MLKIIKASAGSGKTFTLTLEYISLLLSDDNTDGGKPRLYQGYKKGNCYPRERHRNILAVTFTNKATEEMKQRIVLELSILARLNPDGKRSQYLDTLCHRLSTNENDLSEAARNVLTELLFDYTNFNVSTIDSFFQIILRTFAAEVNIPYDYDIELNEDYVLQVGIHNFLTSISSNQKQYTQVLGWLNKYVTSQLAKGKEWNPFILGTRSSDHQSQDNLFSLASVINKEFYRNVHIEMDKYLSNGSDIGLFQKNINKKIESSNELLKGAIKSANDVIKDYGYAEYRKKTGCFASWLTKMETTKYEFSTEMLKSLLKFNGTMTDSLKKLKKGISEPSIEACEKFQQSYNNALRAMQNLLIYTSINRNIYQLGLLGYIAKSVKEFRQENNLIQLSDTNQLLSDIIRTEQDAPFIYERIGTRVKNFLIDEFQDTSAMQWHNMKPLLSESLASGQENLIIGDEKQCIYRFRNSDPSLLQNKVIKEFCNYLPKETDPKNRNWRSTPNIIKFNNTLFYHLAEATQLKDIYSNVIQLTNSKKRNLDGYIRIEMLQKDEMKKVTTRIPNLIYEILDRGYKQSDIAILVDRNTEGAQVIEQLLEHNKNKTDNSCEDLRVVSSDSLLLINSPSIRLIVSHLRYLGISESIVGTDEEIKNRKELNERLHRLLRQYEQLMNRGATPEEALDKCFSTPDQTEQSLKDIRSFMPENTETYSLVSVVERIINEVLSDEAKHDENPFIQAFQDLVIDFSNRYTASILSFLRWWDRTGNRYSISSPAGADAINVMTIHKSKGLEFPCVIIPFANWQIGKMDSILWVSKSDMESTGIFSEDEHIHIPPITPISTSEILKDSALREPYNNMLRESVSDCMNKTYVAFTRAVDELYIFTEEHKGKSEGATKPLSYYLNDFASKCGSDYADKINQEFAAKTGSEDADIAAYLRRESGSDVNSDLKSMIYELGKPMNNDRAAKDDTANDREEKQMSDYKVSERSELVKFNIPDLTNTERQEGSILHKVLCYIHTHHDVDHALFYCKARHIIPDDKYEDVAKIIKNLICQSPEVESWFADDNHIFNERTIISGENRPRPDRIILTPEGKTLVVDFKFGKLHSNKYKKQVHEYMHLLNEAGFKNITGKIWYVNDAKIVDVSL